MKDNLLNAAVYTLIASYVLVLALRAVRALERIASIDDALWKINTNLVRIADNTTRRPGL